MSIAQDSVVHTLQMLRAINHVMCDVILKLTVLTQIKLYSIGSSHYLHFTFVQKIIPGHCLLKLYFVLLVYYRLINLEV